MAISSHFLAASHLRHHCGRVHTAAWASRAQSAASSAFWFRRRQACAVTLHSPGGLHEVCFPWEGIQANSISSPNARTEAKLRATSAARRGNVQWVGLATAASALWQSLKTKSRRREKEVSWSKAQDKSCNAFNSQVNAD